MEVPGAETAKQAVNSVKQRLPSIKNIFTLGAFGTLATLGGTLLLPFFGIAAGGAVATAGATPLSVLTSFWTPLITDPLTGQMGISEGLNRAYDGFAALFKSASTVLSAGFNAVSSGTTPFAAMGTALTSPLPA